jgi:polysaccharide biosynthesis transport protein
MITKAEIAPALGEYVAVVRRRSVYLLTIIPITILMSIYLAFSIRPIYQATATILRETSTVQRDVIQTTVASDADQQVEIVQGRVMTSDVLQALVRELDPYPSEKALSVSQKAQHILEDTAVEKVDAVTLKPTVDTNAFSLHYSNSDPALAAAVATRLAQLFLTYNQRTRSEAARQTASFLATQSESISQQLRETDEKLASMKSQHGDALPELVQQNQASLDRTERDLDAIQQQILTAEGKESLLSVQLSQMSPNLITQSGDLTDVATVRAQLAEAEQRYTPDHPEVKRLRHALETLMAQTPASTNGVVEGANNPQYLMAASELTSVRATLAGLRAQATKYREQMNEYEQLLRRTPLVEPEYVEIQRRRQSLQNEYQQIQDKLRNAESAETFETEQRGDRFSLLRAPFVPRSPVYPNRIGFIMLGLVAGCALAGIAVAIAESMGTAIRNPRDLPTLDDAPLLASIPRIQNSRDRRRRRIIFASVFAFYGFAIVFVAGTVVSALHVSAPVIDAAHPSSR